MSAALSFVPRKVHRNLPVEALASQAVARGQCVETCDGALVLRTGRFTGRAPDDRYIVDDEQTREQVAWGKANQPISPEAYLKLRAHVAARLSHAEVFEVDAHAGGEAGVRLRILTTSPAHALFCRHLFQAPRPEWSGASLVTVLHDPDCAALVDQHSTRSGTFIVLSPSDRTILVGGTGYAGEVKKAVFSLLNYLLPESGILPMHAAVNVGESGESAVFFGLSGTGKTTLSADPERRLLGDDEHGWSDAGLFNIEGGCYAKTIDLSEEYEPQIWRAVHRPYVLLENVVIDPTTGKVNFADRSLTENTRAAYPLSELERVATMDLVPPPRHVLFLTADAFGVLPPVAKLSLDQAVYYFLSGYTAKLAGTELNQLQPQPTFSTCFGAPFMPRPAFRYAELLRSRIAATASQVWLVNTGWIEGPYGEGRRMPIAETRRIVSAILNDELASAPLAVEPWFGLSVPREISGVPSRLFDVKAGWRQPSRYDEQALALARRFDENFAAYRAGVPDSVVRAGPDLSRV